MDKTITVRGVGKVSVKPDTAALTLVLSSIDERYDAAMILAEKQLDELRGSFGNAGFEKGEIKTVDFRVTTEKKNVPDMKGNYTSVFLGYRCVHTLRLTFDLDPVKLGNAISAATSCAASPEISIAFTVRDKYEVSSEILARAAKSAHDKASVLAEASGVKLGDLIRIDYDFAGLNMQSPTRFLACNADSGVSARSMDIEPDDINVSDSVSFTWAIEPARSERITARKPEVSTAPTPAAPVSAPKAPAATIPETPSASDTSAE